MTTTYPVDPVEPVDRRPEMTPEEWRLHILSVMGRWHGDLERPDQGDFEVRDSM